MMNQMNRGLPPTHPGELLREDILPALGKPKTEIARALGVSRQTLYDLLDEKQPVSPQMAIRLGKLIGNGAGVWLRLQAAFDLATLEPQMSAEVEKIPTLKAA